MSAKLPELPEIMDKANQALSYLASGQIPQSSKSYLALNEKKLEDNYKSVNYLFATIKIDNNKFK